MAGSAAVACAAQPIASVASRSPSMGVKPARSAGWTRMQPRAVPPRKSGSTAAGTWLGSGLGLGLGLGLGKGVGLGLGLGLGFGLGLGLGLGNRVGSWD